MRRLPPSAHTLAALSPRASEYLRSLFTTTTRSLSKQTPTTKTRQRQWIQSSPPPATLERRTASPAPTVSSRPLTPSSPPLRDLRDCLMLQQALSPVAQWALPAL